LRFQRYEAGMNIQIQSDPKEGQIDILDRLDFNTLSYQEIVDCIAKVKLEFEQLNALKSSSIEKMDHKLKVLKLWRKLIEHFISIEHVANETIATAIVATESNKSDELLDSDIETKTPHEPLIEKSSDIEPSDQSLPINSTLVLKERDEKKSSSTLSPREMAEKIDRQSKYISIQLLEASFIRGVNMPKGVFIIVDGHEAHQLVKTGKATLLNQN
jgi:hypothetical protein